MKQEHHMSLHAILASATDTPTTYHYGIAASELCTRLSESAQRRGVPFANTVLEAVQGYCEEDLVHPKHPCDDENFYPRHGAPEVMEQRLSRFNSMVMPDVDTCPDSDLHDWLVKVLADIVTLQSELRHLDSMNPGEKAAWAPTINKIIEQYRVVERRLHMRLNNGLVSVGMSGAAP